MNLENHLNPEQLAAVTSGDGPILVLAGAGSGKTRTLTYRAAWLLSNGIKPENIVLATFTNKAANAMLQRVHTITGTSTEKLWGGTFHHLANRVLRKHSSLLGYKEGYTILDSNDSLKLIKACIAETGINNKSEMFPREAIIADIHSYASNTVQNIESTILNKYPNYLANYLTNFIKEIEAIIKLYKRKKTESNTMDFDDLLVNWKELLSTSQKIKENYANRFRYILIDEYQDTNKLQSDIIELLASHHRNLMVVGDDSQSIYSFRGANYDNIIKFPERYPDAKIIKITTNYRSTPEILNIANKSIANNENQFQKTLQAIRPAGSHPVKFTANDVSHQALFVIDQIRNLLQDGIPFNEIAVLYRAHYHSMELEMKLFSHGIPYTVRSGIRFFEKAHIKDIVAYLRIIVNPRDESAWIRILQLYAGIGLKKASRIWKYISSQESPLDTIFKQDFVNCGGKGVVRKSLAKLGATLQQLALSQSKNPNTAELIDHTLHDYRELLQAKYTDASSREEEIEQFTEYSTKFSSLKGFLSGWALSSSMADTGENITRANTQEDQVVLSTIHQAKGLEWQAVFLIGCAEGMLPLGRALRENRGEEEERRLFYVACTRAKDKLYFCYPKTKYSHDHDGITLLSPSRFLEELK